MKIEHIHDRYFQKSYAFLYPQLKIRRAEEFHPVQTYLSTSLDVTRGEEPLLFCKYKNSPHIRWSLFQQEKLLVHPLLDRVMETGSEEMILYVFNLAPIREDYDNFLAGKYSQFTPEFRQRLATYYGVQSPKWAKMEPWLYPGRYKKQYLELLWEEKDRGKGETLLSLSGELCNKYDPERELYIGELAPELVEQTKNP